MFRVYIDNGGPVSSPQVIQQDNYSSSMGIPTHSFLQDISSDSHPKIIQLDARLTGSSKRFITESEPRTGSKVEWTTLYSRSASTKRSDETGTTAVSNSAPPETYTRKLRRSRARCTSQEDRVAFGASLRPRLSNRSCHKKTDKPKSSLRNAGTSKQARHPCPTLLDFPQSDSRSLLPPVRERKELVIRSYLDRTQERARLLERQEKKSPRMFNSVPVQSRREREVHDSVSVVSSTDMKSFRSQLSSITVMSRRSIKLKDPTKTGVNYSISPETYSISSMYHIR